MKVSEMEKDLAPRGHFPPRSRQQEWSESSLAASFRRVTEVDDFVLGFVDRHRVRRGGIGFVAAPVKRKLN